MKTTIEKIELARLSTEDGNDQWEQLLETGIRYDTDFNVVDDYAERMVEGDKFPPIVVFREGDELHVADGFHRIAAAEKNDFKDIEAEIHEGTRLDALWYALGANRQHGHRLSSRDKRCAILRAVKEFPDKGNRAIADHIGVSESYVRKVIGAECPEVRTGAHVTGKDGKSYPAKKPKASTPPAEPVEPGDGEKSQSYIAPEVRDDDEVDAEERAKLAECERTIESGETKPNEPKRSTKKSKPIPAAIDAALNRLETEIRLCAGGGWNRCDKDELVRRIKVIINEVQI